MSTACSGVTRCGPREVRDERFACHNREDKRSRSEVILATAVLGVVALLVMPLPAMVLDAFLAMSIGISLLVLLVALGVARRWIFLSFPRCCSS
jgi:type III secretory pathway component EscV